MISWRKISTDCASPSASAISRGVQYVAGKVEALGEVEDEGAEADALDDAAEVEADAAGHAALPCFARRGLAPLAGRTWRSAAGREACSTLG